MRQRTLFHPGLRRLSSAASVVTLFLSAFLVAPAMATPQDDPSRQAKDETSFVRLQRDRQSRPYALETAIARYRPRSEEGELVVDLVGVVHVGDRSYYRRLNRELEKYDVVLYELVAAPEARVPRPQRRDNLLAVVMTAAQSVLDLHSQIDLIDYTRENFVHADLSPGEMAAAIEKRGDNALTIALGVAADLIRQENRNRRLRAPASPAPRRRAAEPIDPLSWLLDGSGPLELKQLLAEQLAGNSATGLGPTLETILIEDRNKAALKVLQKEIARGKKHIAIFYGAGHMPDFEKRLLADFDLKREDTRWLTAWDLDRPAPTPLDQLLRILPEMMEPVEPPANPRRRF